MRTTVDIPEPLHERLRDISTRRGTSVRTLILEALEQNYSKPKKGRPVTGPMIKGKGKRGPAFPTDENPHDFVFS